MGKYIYLVMALYWFAAPSFAFAKEIAGNTEIGWISIDGKPLPNTPARKAKNGFGGWIILTDNLSWEKEWRKRDGKPPVFKSPGVIKKGSFVELLIFISNPKLKPDMSTDVRCDISVRDPSGKIDVLHTDLRCFNAKITTSPLSLRVINSAASLHFDSTDPAGAWEFQVRLLDKIGGTLLYLTEKFTLK